MSLQDGGRGLAWQWWLLPAEAQNLTPSLPNAQSCSAPFGHHPLSRALATLCRVATLLLPLSPWVWAADGLGSCPSGAGISLSHPSADPGGVGPGPCQGPMLCVPWV